ncbi:hypothetical protein AMATHDRAFT_2489 [Amanita thiersii Skay4041]|uniref:Helicase ATP-binding domain-containing protein n=1 Tax=Amanita thiersii Skay4041 TaxID=703135 RepID=A0A2A9NW70_9AGAR|nr:hypothetical protein AMATHDRAFT_2489 [Amanita thiersii Skay4041]
MTNGSLSLNPDSRRKPQYKKHKTWDGDGILVVKGIRAELHDLDGRMLSSGKVPLQLPQEQPFFVGEKEVELDRVLSSEEFLSGSCFSNTTNPSAALTSNTTSCRKPFKSLSISTKPNPPVNSTKKVPLASTAAHSVNVQIKASSWSAQMYHDRNTSRESSSTVYVSASDNELIISEGGRILCAIPDNGLPLATGVELQTENGVIRLIQPVDSTPIPCSKLTTNRPFIPVVTHPKQDQSHTLESLQEFKPLHDPNKDGAIVMKNPSADQAKLHARRSSAIIPVVLDPFLAKFMRPHQIEGVRFLYESVMGLRKHEGYGCILADTMGLGKSLQTIGLIWTLLKQSPYPDKHPAAKKVLLVCPVTLAQSWKLEFKKWLGEDRINVVVCEENQVAKQFANGLKAAGSKTNEVFHALRTRRRVILSGTPIQNDLREFHAMADFCNPGLLDDYTVFRRIYENPIVRGRAPDALPDETELGKIRAMQLQMITQSFVLRRVKDELKGNLPPKYEYIIFVSPTALQVAVYQNILQPDAINDLVQTSTAESLAMINMLIKISNSPLLLKATLDNGRAKAQMTQGVKQSVALIPKHAEVGDVTLSGKLNVVAKMLRLIYQTTDEKCVLVSHYTSTLNILEVYCKKNGYSFLRLDGNTPGPKRQELVNRFNKSSKNSCFIFLLSSKAGGTGLNLIGNFAPFNPRVGYLTHLGASRLYLIDSDWNPSHDLQAMARCHREGQKRPVFIYRLLTTGTIDEKIYQRQVMKLGLSDSLIGSSSVAKSDSFTKSELRDIFRLDLTTACNTHDLLRCECNGLDGFAQAVDAINGDTTPIKSKEERIIGFVNASQVKYPTTPSPRDLALTALQQWQHIDCSTNAVAGLQDSILQSLIDLQQQKQGVCSSEDTGAHKAGSISFIFGRNTVDSEAPKQYKPSIDQFPNAI